MDPLFTSVPSRSGRCEVGSSVSLQYELRGSPDAIEKMVLIMGAFATKRHFEQLADSLAAAGGGRRIEVLTYDHRGIGLSTASQPAQSQTSELLAADALALINHVWSPHLAERGCSLHVYGASMGGMVAQRLALSLLQSSGSSPAAHLPLRSLTLAVTAHCYGLARFIPLGAWFYRLVLPMALASTPTVLVDSMLPKFFSADFIAAKNPQHPEGATNGALWRRRWIAEFDEWFSLRENAGETRLP